MVMEVQVRPGQSQGAAGEDGSQAARAPSGSMRDDLKAASAESSARVSGEGFVADEKGKRREIKKKRRNVFFVSIVVIVFIVVIVVVVFIVVSVVKGSGGDEAAMWW